MCGGSRGVDVVYEQNRALERLGGERARNIVAAFEE
jgi:hypothetical protein